MKALSLNIRCFCILFIATASVPIHFDRSLTQLRRDTQLLNSLNIMDYSLLLGIHYRDRPIPAELQEDMSAEEMEQLGTLACVGPDDEMSPT
jgi:hypothetical protein